MTFVSNYQIYGLDLVSEIEFEGLDKKRGGSGPVLYIALNPELRLQAICDQTFERRIALEAPGEGLVKAELAINARGYFFIYHYSRRAVVYFLNAAKDRLEVINDNAILENSVNLLMHPILAWVARLKGRTCLHANVIEKNGEAIAILGDKGAGKSTSCAVLLNAGYRMVADDVCALLENGDGFYALPGQPRPKLYESTVAALFPAGVITERFLDMDKVSIHDKAYVAHARCTEPVKLKALYIIVGRDAQLSRPISELCSRSTAMTLLGQHVIFNQGVEREIRKNDFLVLSRLTGEVPVKRLRNPGTIDALKVSLAECIDSE